MHQLMRQGLSARAQREGGDALGARVTGKPQPGRFGRAAELEAQFIQLHMGELQSAHQPIV